MPALFANFVSVQVVTLDGYIISLKSTREFPSIIFADDYFYLLLTDGTNSEIVKCVTNDKSTGKLGLEAAPKFPFSPSNTWVEVVATAEEYIAFVDNTVTESAESLGVKTKELGVSGIEAFSTEMHVSDGDLYWGSDDLSVIQQGANNVPIGTVIMFAGSLTSLPPNWKLCDGGTHSGYQTPNLTDRFIKATDDPALVDIISDGADSIKIDLDGGHSHTQTVTGLSVFDASSFETSSTPLTEDQMPSHQHVISDGFATYYKYLDKPEGVGGLTKNSYTATSTTGGITMRPFDIFKNPWGDYSSYPAQSTIWTTYCPAVCDMGKSDELKRTDLKGGGFPALGHLRDGIEINSLDVPAATGHSHTLTTAELSHTHTFKPKASPDHTHATRTSGGTRLNYATDCQRYQLMFIIKIAEPDPATFGVK